MVMYGRPLATPGASIHDNARMNIRDPQVVLCTNMRGAGIAERLELETGVPVYDTVAATVWKCLKMVDVDIRRVRGWGRLFQDLA